MSESVTEGIDLRFGFVGGKEIVLTITGDIDDPALIISAIRKISQTDYLLQLHDMLRGVDPDDYEDEDWDE